MTPRHWIILTGEYPPQYGGVADYTRLVADALAHAGDAVEVWAPRYDRTDAPGPVAVHRLPDHFGWRGLRELSKRLREPDPRRIVLVQYVPHAFGFKAMNVPFCAWLHSLKQERIWTMFHEVTFPFERHQPLRHRLLAAVNHLMAMMVARASQRVLVSTQAWTPLLKPLSASGTPIDWAPIPSNLPSDITPGKRNGELIVSHFGTYGGPTASMLRQVIESVLRDAPTTKVNLIGRGSEAFAAPLGPRVIGTGNLPADDVACALSAADVVVQPYPDGATTRRSSLMAALALGRAVVTTEGHLTEPLWRQSGAVALKPADDAQALAAEVLALLHNELRRRDLGQRASTLYDQHFALHHTISLLRQSAQEAQ